MKSDPPSYTSHADKPQTDCEVITHETELDIEFMFRWFKEMLYGASARDFCALTKEVGEHSFCKVLEFRDSSGKSLIDYAAELAQKAERDHENCIKTFQRDHIKDSLPFIVVNANHYSNILLIKGRIENRSPVATQAQ